MPINNLSLPRIPADGIPVPLSAGSSSSSDERAGKERNNLGNY